MLPFKLIDFISKNRNPWIIRNNAEHQIRAIISLSPKNTTEFIQTPSETTDIIDRTSSNTDQKTLSEKHTVFILRQP